MKRERTLPKDRPLVLWQDERGRRHLTPIPEAQKETLMEMRISGIIVQFAKIDLREVIKNMGIDLQRVIEVFSPDLISTRGLY